MGRIISKVIPPITMPIGTSLMPRSEYYSMTDEEIGYVIDALNDFC